MPPRTTPRMRVLPPKTPRATPSPCKQFPWRIANHGKRHRHGFYTKRNLTRLWNQIRNGGRAQSCHITDPSTPEHVAAGAKPGTTPMECIGSITLVTRELNYIKTLASGDTIDTTHLNAYRSRSRKRRGLTQSGLIYFLVERHMFGHLPDCTKWINDPAIGRPGEPHNS